jgi:hypothetical protein
MPYRLSAFAIGAALSFSCATGAQAAVTISTAATSNMNCVSGVCTPTAKDAVLNVNDLTTMLATGNVQVNTGSGKLAAHVRDIRISDGFSWASTNSLTLSAFESVTFDKAVSVAGSAPVSLVTNNGGTGGTLSFGPKGSLSFLSPSNSLTIDGQTYTLANSVGSLAADIAGNPSGFYALSASYDAGPDGIYGASPIPTTFTGTFNGLGNSISHLSISGSASDMDIALFAYVDTTGVINSLRVTSANIRVKKNSDAAVVAAISYGTVFNTFSSGKVRGATGNTGLNSLFAGLVGGNAGTILDDASSAIVTAEGQGTSAFAEAGGLVGYSAGTVAESYATGTATVAGTGNAATAGGLIGNDNGLVENCYAEGAATIGNSGEVGGLAGENDLTIETSYSTGAATGGPRTDVGGSLGYDGSQVDGGSVSDIYWDTTTSGITNLSQGAGNIANDPGITGETSAQLQAGLPAGFDPTIWAESPSINNGFPYLINNPPQ